MRVLAKSQCELTARERLKILTMLALHTKRNTAIDAIKSDSELAATFKALEYLVIPV